MTAGFDRLDYEIVMRQAVEADISRMRKMLDDTNVVRLHLESDIESLKEELITLRKYHKAVRKIYAVYLCFQISQPPLHKTDLLQ